MSSTSRSRVTAVLLAAVVLIGGANLAAYAATGQPLLLGKSNTAGKKTTVTNTGNGPALHLRTRPGQPPLKVNRTTKVGMLNADRVDGRHASALLTTGHRYVLPGTTLAEQHTFDFPALPPGRYLMSYSVLTWKAPQPVCYVQNDELQAMSLGTGGAGSFHTHAGSAVVDTSVGPVSLACQAYGENLQVYSTSGGGWSEVTFTQLDRGTSGIAGADSGPLPRGAEAPTPR